MAVNYNDERLQAVTNEKNNALNNLNQSYNSMISNTDSYYQQQVDATKEYAQKQSELQQANTDFAIEKIEQQKQQAQKDYTKEQKGAYTDYQKQINDYGVNAEQMASQGLNNTGYSESSKVGMFNTYQNRVASARESYNKAVLNYNNGIKEAQLQNNSALAEISYNALKTQLELSLQGFQYKNTLLQNQLNSQQSIESLYQTKWQSVLDQINTENALAEQIRQYNESLALEKQQLEFQKQQARGGSSYDNLLELLTDGSSGNQWGYFSNGYQPKGIDGYGAVSKTGKTIMVTKGNGTLATQNIWKTPDGTKWYWDGSSRTYKKYSGQKVV